VADLTLRHELDCDASTYWDKCAFDPEFSRRLFFEELKFRSYEVLEHKDMGDTIVRRVKAEPQVPNLPAPVKKVLGDSFGYVEEGTFDKKAQRYTFRTIPAAFPEKVKIEGSMTCEPLGDKRIARIAKMHVEAKVFMIGGMVEERIIADIKHSYAKAAELTNIWVKEKGY
jgi:hypothetical protein